MDCEHAITLISARFDHEITPSDHAALELHLKDCAACRATAEAFALQDHDLRESFEPRRRAVGVIATQVKAELASGGCKAPAAVNQARKTARSRRMSVVIGVISGALAASLPFLLYFGLQGIPQSPRPLLEGFPPTPRPAGAGDVLALKDELAPRQRPADPPPTRIAVSETVQTKPGERRRVSLPDGSILYVNQNTTAHLDAERSVKLDRGEVFVEVAPHGAEDVFVVKAPGRDVKALGTKFEVRADGDKTGVVVTQGKVQVSGLSDTLQAGQALGIDGRVEPAARASHLLDWARDLMAAAESPLVPASAYAGGSLIAVDSNGQEAKLGLRKYTVDVHIEDGFARTTIDQTYFNQHPWRLEGTFYFPLPPDASLSRLAMYVSDNNENHLQEGGMAERSHARQVYDRIVNNQRDPALLEWVDGSTFKMRVFPLEGRQEKRIILSYTQRLPGLYGRTQYRFPAGHSIQTVREWNFHAVVKGGANLAVSSPTHPLVKSETQGDDLVLTDQATEARVDKDVVLDIGERRGVSPPVELPAAEAPAGSRRAAPPRFVRAELDGQHYLALRYRPELASQAQRQRRDWVFLFESSADRDPLLARTQIEIIRHLLTNAEHDDTFAIVTAGTRTRLFRDEPVPATPENVAAAMQFIEQTHLIGVLDLGRAFRAVTPLLQRGGNPHLIHLGSGMAAIGTKQDAVAKLLPAGIRYVGIGVGKRWNRAFMKEQAEKTGGFFTQINPDETVSWRAFDLLATLNTPRLLDVKVMADNGSQAAPRFLVDGTMLAQGEELFAATRLVDRDRLPEVVTVTGTLDGKPFRAELPVKDMADGAGYLPRTWAKLELDRLLSEYRGQQERRDEIVALSKAMYVMTPFTSLLVLENDAMYEEFKVDRGRKDHWAMYPCPPKTPLVYEPLATEIDARNAPTGLKPRANQVRPTIITRTPPRWVRVPGENRTDRWSDEAPGIVEERKKVEWSLGLPLSDPRRDPLDEFFVNLNQANTGSLMFGLGVNSDRGLTGSIVLRDRAPMSKMDRASFDEVESGVEERLISNIKLGRRWEQTPDPLREFNVGGGTPDIQEQVADLLPETEKLTVGLTIRSAQLFSRGQNSIPFPDEPGIEFPSPMTINGGTLNFRGVVPQLADLPITGTLFRDVDRLSAARQRDSYGGSAPGLGDFYDLGVGRSSGEEPRLTYDRFSFTNDGRLFTDLVTYAPGLNTSRADILTVLDAEAAPELRAAPGRVDPEAAALIDKARRAGWQAITLGGDKDKPGIVLTFDGAGRYVYERLVSFGLHERVICDGKTLLHLYPEIGLGARRTVSRFHRMELARLVPWWLPPVGDLARGQDVLWSKERPNAIALVPAGLRERVGARSETMPQQGAIRYLQTVLIFAEDGRLAERQLVEMPANKIHVREIYDGKGGVSIIDGKDKELFSSKRELKPASEPELNPDLASLVVLPLPYRSRQHTFAVADLDPSQSLTSEVNGCHPYLKHEKVMALLATLLAEQKSDDALELVRTHFLDRGDRRPGLFSLLAACGADLGGEMAFDKLLADSPGSPLIRYLALGASNGYRVIRNRMPVNLGTAVAPKDTFLGRLAIARDLAGRWNEGVPWWLRSAERRVDSARTLAFVHDNRDSVLGWALLTWMQDRRSAEYVGMAQAWDELGGPDKDFRAQYERACCLADAGRKLEARNLFQELYARALKAGVLPPIDRRFTGALLGEIQNDDEWTPLIRRTAADFINKKQRVAVVYLAWQCRQLRDPALAENLLELALEGIGDDAERLAVHGAALDYLWQARQYDRADALLRGLLENEKWQKAPALWRLAARFAEQRGQEDRSIACLERALDLEFQHLPEVIDLQSWRRDYGKLLAYYRVQAAQLVQNRDRQGAEAATPLPDGRGSELVTRTVRAVDRWRAHDPESAEACKTAGEVLRLLGKTELAWEYYTTPTAVQPERAMSEGSLSTHFAEKGDHGLAELAYELATDADPTDAQILWDRAQNLRQAGRKEEADHWLQKLVNDPGKNNWDWREVRERAQWELERQ